MDMLPGGIDVFYIDESANRNLYVVLALAIPMLRPHASGIQKAWRDWFDEFKKWRRTVERDLNIPVRKEPHGVKFAAGRGNYYQGKYSFTKGQSATTYRNLMRSLTFPPPNSLMSVAATRADSIYGSHRLEAAMYKLFQWMRTHAVRDK